MDDIRSLSLHQGGKVETAGRPLGDAQAAMILIHGRGASAMSILELAEALEDPNFAYLAPQATNNTWYPYSFLAPIESNEPWLSSALQVIRDLMGQVEAAGIALEHCILAGFSQGACLAAAYVARNPRRYGGLLVFSGGLIGPPGTLWGDSGDLDGTPTFIGCSNIDPHIPLSRVYETSTIFEKMGAQVKEVIYPNMGHTIIQDEIDQAMQIVKGIFPSV